MTTEKFRVWNGVSMEYNVLVGKLGAVFCEGVDPEDSASISPFNTIYPDTVDVMRYTQMDDEDGKEIYYKDIIKVIPYDPAVKPFLHRVENDEDGCLAIDILSTFDYETTTLQWARGFPTYYTYKVVGNMYENPELVELDKNRREK